MNGLPSHADLTQFAGQRLDQICFGTWVVEFRFDGPVRIVVESTIVLLRSGDEPKRIDDFRNGAGELCMLIGLEVVLAERTSAGGMILGFSNGLRMEIEKSNVGYESFQVHLGNQVLVA